MPRTPTDEIVRGYIQEVTAYLAPMREGIAAFRDRPEERSALEEVHRMVHTIKGASAMLEMAGLSQMALQMEDAVEAVLDGRLDMNESLHDAMIGAVDRFEIYCRDFQGPGAAGRALLADTLDAFGRIRGNDGQGNGDLLAKGLIAMAIVSMTVGNLAAIAQKDFKRLMAFSSIAHAGYLLIGILCMTPEGYRGTLFYAVAVLAMKFTCFMVMIRVAADGRNLQISEFAGLHRRAPLLALALMMALFGLAGIPPTIGFAGKFMIFVAAVQNGYLGLVVVAMINVVVSLYYYLLVLKAAYLDEPAAEMPPLAVKLPSRVLAIAMVAIIVAVGFYPHPLLRLVEAAALKLP